MSREWVFTELSQVITILVKGRVWERLFLGRNVSRSSLKLPWNREHRYWLWIYVAFFDPKSEGREEKEKRLLAAKLTSGKLNGNENGILNGKNHEPANGAWSRLRSEPCIWKLYWRLAILHSSFYMVFVENITQRELQKKCVKKMF